MINGRVSVWVLVLELVDFKVIGLLCSITFIFVGGKGVKLIVLDTETTGLKDTKAVSFDDKVVLADRGSEIIEVGGLIVEDSRELANYGQMTPFCVFCDIIGAESELGAKRVHGIDMQEVRHYVRGQFLHNVMRRYVPEFFEDDVLFVGHNILFDMRMLWQGMRNVYDVQVKEGTTTIIPKHGRVMYDTIKYTQTSKGKRRKLDSFKNELAREFNEMLVGVRDLKVRTNAAELLITCNIGAHNALYDALWTFVVWKEQIWDKKLI